MKNKVLELVNSLEFQNLTIMESELFLKRLMWNIRRTAIVHSLHGG